MLYLNENGINLLIKKLKTDTIDPYWNNYTFVIWEKNINGFYNKNGEFRNGSWGISNVFPIKKDGVWSLPKKYVRHFKQSKHR